MLSAMYLGVLTAIAQGEFLDVFEAYWFVFDNSFRFTFWALLEHSRRE